MKTVDDFIRENPGRFDAEQPPAGHLERFNARLSGLELKKRPGMRTLILRIAAIVLLGFIVTYAAIREFGLVETSVFNRITATSNSEFNEAEQFYTSQLSIYYDRIKTLGFNNDQTEKRQVLKELSEMDEQVQAMKHDLEQNPDDERIVHAIINFYQVKIELMDMIIARAQPTTNTIL